MIITVLCSFYTNFSEVTIGGFTNMNIGHPGNIIVCDNLKYIIFRSSRFVPN